VPTIIASAASLIAALGVGILSFFEHRRSVHPSTLLTLYLLASLAGNSVHVTNPANRTSLKNRSQIFAQIFAELAFLIVENWGKRSSLRARYQNISPEDTSGIIGKALFWWINPILRDGNRSILVGEELPPTDDELSSQELQKRIVLAWQQRGLTPT
jgi:ATP-binding cassette subfamily C (CFTR/MRP) protein 1